MRILQLKDIDFSILRHIELKLVGLGYYPDESLLTDAQVEPAIDALRASNNLIEPRGVANYLDKGEIVGSRVGVERGMIQPSDDNIANFEEYIDELGGIGNPADIYELPQFSKNIDYSIRVVAEDQRKDYLIYDAIMSALPESGILSIFDVDNGTATVNQEKCFEILFLRMIDVSSTDYIEKIYQFRVTDVVIEELTRTEEAIQEMADVTISLQFNEFDPNGDIVNE